MASNDKSDIVETERPVPGDIEKRPSWASDDSVLATKFGNDQDQVDMRRLGKKQQLNVRCTYTCTLAHN